MTNFGSGRSRMQNVACWRMPSGICCFVWNETRPTLPHARSSRKPVWSFRHSRSVQRSSRRRNSSTMPELHCSAKPCRCTAAVRPLGGAAPTRDRRRGPGKASEVRRQFADLWARSPDLDEFIKNQGWNATANKLGSLPKQTRRQTRASTSSIDIRKNISARKKAPTCSGLESHRRRTARPGAIGCSRCKRRVARFDRKERISDAYKAYVQELASGKPVAKGESSSSRNSSESARQRNSWCKDRSMTSLYLQMMRRQPRA